MKTHTTLAAALIVAGATLTTLAQTAAPPLSPRGTASAQVSGSWATQDGRQRYSGGKWITIDYGRPLLRGRANIFGAGADYGKVVSAGAPVWRAGANATTALSTEVPLVFGGKTIAAGTYSVFVELKEQGWTLVLSSQPVQEKYDPNDKVKLFGAYNYDAKYDVVRVPMKMAKSPVSVEQFTIGFVNMTQAGGSIAMWWDKDLATVDFTVGSGS
jgi:hypothetical protein